MRFFQTHSSNRIAGKSRKRSFGASIESLEGRQLLSGGQSPASNPPITAGLQVGYHADPSDPTDPTSPNEVNLTDGVGTSNPISTYTIDWGDGTTSALVWTLSSGIAKNGSWLTVYAPNNSSAVFAEMTPGFDYEGDIAVNVNGGIYDESGWVNSGGNVADATHYPDGLIGFSPSFGVDGDHTYSKPGNYTINVLITDMLGNSLSEETTVQVGPNPIAEPRLLSVGLKAEPDVPLTVTFSKWRHGHR